MSSAGLAAVNGLKGALAGAAAMWVMNQVTTWMYQHEPQEVKDAENEARGGRTAYEIAVEKGAALAGVALSDDQRSEWGGTLHIATGVGAGMLYGMLRPRLPALSTGQGMAYGTAMYLVVDELLNPLVGTTPGPQAFPWQTHARGFVGHLAFGLTAELLLEQMDRLAA